MTTYRVLSPDNIDTEPQVYHNLRQAKKALTRFVHRYTAQGYYSQTCYNGYVRHIPLTELPDYCTIQPI